MNWHLLPDNKIEAERLASQLQIPVLLAQLLINRNISEPSLAQAFLKPNLNDLSDPYLLTGIKPALERINRALKHKEKIVIYGDYDTDGVTATALLVNMFKLIGVTVDFYIPHRLDEGYGLNISALDKIAKGGAKLVITVDCGITNLDEVKYANKLGLDVIITDHHEPLCDNSGSYILPEAIAIINPKINPGSFRELSGVGVAFKLVWAFTGEFSNTRKRSGEFQQFLAEAISLVVVGTITDVVPLEKENRVLTAYGLPLIKNISLPWLDALIKTSRIDRRYLSPRDISFRIGPRLNAGGRLGNAHLAAEILMTPSNSRALELAEQLEKANQNRQRIEKRILDAARERIENEMDLEDTYVIVLADKEWHSGVLGIVAAKLADEFHRPTILFAIKGESAKGSARSVQSFHLYEALRNCSSLLTRFGGHSYAAGLEIKNDNMESFTSMLNQYAKSKLSPEDLHPFLEIDAEVSFDQLTVKTVSQIEHLAPFGEGNPEPLLLSRGVKIAGEPRLVGNNDEHCAFVIKQEGRGDVSSHRVIAFRMGKRWDELLKNKDKTFQVVYTPEIDHWNNQTEVVLNLKDFKPEK